MAFDRLLGAALAATLVLGLSVSAPAQDDAADAGETLTAEEAVVERREAMRTNGSILRSAGRATGEEAVAAMRTVLGNFERFPGLFPEGSIVGESDALPAVWENWDEFVAITERAADAARDAIAAAEAGDADAYNVAFRAIGATCNECHQQFRR